MYKPGQDHGAEILTRDSESQTLRRWLWTLAPSTEGDLSLAAHSQRSACSRDRSEQAKSDCSQVPFALLAHLR